MPSPNLIACRIASYGNYQDRGWSHLPSIGIRHVEIPVPAPQDVAAVRARLDAHGLTASSVQSRCDATQPDALDVMKPQLAACAALGTRICFMSAKVGDSDPRVVDANLGRIGELARSLNITVVLETHPDLITNGDIALATMQRLDHPALRVNFDTGNIYFYNQGRTAVDELKKIVDYVAAVHLKDTTGGYQEWNFPALGTGVVDFPAVFSILNARGFHGPFTMELEGTKGIERTEPQQLDYIAQSVDYLRRIQALA